MRAALVVALALCGAAVTACDTYGCFVKDANASVAVQGCYAVSALPNGANVTDVTPRMNHSLSLNASTCAEACLTFSAASGVAYPVLAAYQVVDGRCLCYNGSSVAGGNVTTTSNNGAPAACADGFATLWKARLACPLNVSECGGHDNCQVRDGCCVRKPEGPELPGYYNWLFRYVLVIIVVMAVLEALIYGCLRARIRGRWQDVEDGALEQPAVVRSPEEANALSTRLLETFPSATTAASPLLAVGAGKGSQEDAPTCVICLDEFDGLPAVRLPCAHVLHAHCLQEFMSHQLQKQNNVSCPLCRDSVIGDISLP